MRRTGSSPATATSASSATSRVDPLPLPTFRRNETPRLQAALPRPSTSGRGYDYSWERSRNAFAKRNPFCLFCLQENPEVPVPLDVVDHIVPLTDGGERLKWWNLMGLCHLHHNGLKRQLERLARRLGDVTILLRWCRDPASRPDLSQERD